jgi:nucleoside-triphosphatase THEP1
VILRRFVTEKAIESHKKALLARIGGICADVADRIGKMDSAITKVRSSVRRVVDNINVSNQFAAIDSIDMHVSTSSHPLVDALRRTAEFAGIATSAQVDLFSREATNDERGRIIGARGGSAAGTRRHGHRPAVHLVAAL